MREARTSEAALDALKATILDPATPAIVLAVDVPMRAAMLGVSWTRLCALFDEREARQRRRRHRARRNVALTTRGRKP